MLYDVGLWDESSQTVAGRIRFGMPTTENDAAHRAMHHANELQRDMCVVVERTNEVVQVIHYYPTHGG